MADDFWLQFSRRSAVALWCRDDGLDGFARWYIHWLQLSHLIGWSQWPVWMAESVWMASFKMEGNNFLLDVGENRLVEGMLGWMASALGQHQRWAVGRVGAPLCHSSYPRAWGRRGQCLPERRRGSTHHPISPSLPPAAVVVATNSEEKTSRRIEPMKLVSQAGKNINWHKVSATCTRSI